MEYQQMKEIGLNAKEIKKLGEQGEQNPDEQEREIQMEMKNGGTNGQEEEQKEKTEVKDDKQTEDMMTDGKENTGEDLKQE